MRRNDLLSYRWFALLFILSGCSPSAPGYFNYYSSAAPTPSSSPSPHVFSWQFSDGDGVEGFNHDTTRGAKLPQGVVMNGNLYTAWREQTSGSTHDNIRVSEYSGSNSWTSIDGGGATGINSNTNNFASSPSIATVSNTLYVAWHENDAHYFIHVSIWNGNSSFTAADNIANGLNYSNAEDAQNPILATFNGTLFCSWHENGQTRVAKFAGGTTWTFVDGGGATGINYNSALTSNAAFLTTYGTDFYGTWIENNAGGVAQVRVAKYGGGSVWTFVDGNGVNGLNDSVTTPASGSQLIAYNGKLILIWTEAGVVRAKSYDGSTWTSIDGGGLNVSLSEVAITNGAVQAGILGSNLVITWTEPSAAHPVSQVRIAQYDGSSWSIIDGDSPDHGLNYDPTRTQFNDSTIIPYNGGLMAMWGEQDPSGVYQVRSSFGQ
jgi:hypothetical protein